MPELEQSEQSLTPEQTLRKGHGLARRLNGLPFARQGERHVYHEAIDPAPLKCRGTVA